MLRPVLIAGAIDDWQALSLWSPDYFKARHGSRPVRVLDRVYSLRRDARYETMELRAYVDKMRNGPDSQRYYLEQWDPFSYAPELKAHVRSPAYVRASSALPPRCWMGSPGVLTPLHADLFHNLFAQIHGKRSVLLVRSKDGRRLGQPALHDEAVYSEPPLDIESVEARQRLTALGVHAIQCVLEPGDLLFVPGGWYHQVRSLTETIMANFFWMTFRRRMLGLGLRALDRARSLRGA